MINHVLCTAFWNAGVHLLMIDFWYISMELSVPQIYPNSVILTQRDHIGILTVCHMTLCFVCMWPHLYMNEASWNSLLEPGLPHTIPSWSYFIPVLRDLFPHMSAVVRVTVDDFFLDSLACLLPSRLSSSESISLTPSGQYYHFSFSFYPNRLHIICHLPNVM